MCRNLLLILAALAMPLVVAMLLMTAMPLTAGAQRAPKVDDQLSSNDPKEFSEGLTRFSSAKRKRPDWWKALSTRIDRGLSPDLLKKTVGAIAESGTNKCEPVLDRLLKHRRPEVRQEALDALVLCAPKAAGPKLVLALDDLNKDVRTAAALALGQISHHEAVPTLFKALDLGLLEAVFGLANNIKPEEADRFLSYLGRVPLDTMGQAVSELLTRNDLPVKIRLEAVAKLEAMATPQAANVLANFVTLHESDKKHQAIVNHAREAISRLTTGGIE